LEPEFNYVVYMAMEARKAGLSDDLNDFEEGEDWPMEIHEAWTRLGCPTSFQAFQRAWKGKMCAISAVPQQDEPPVDAPSTSADQFTGALSAKFGLSEEVLKTFSSKAIARAHCSSDLPKNSSTGRKYKPLKGVAREEASMLIDQALTNLLQLSQKHGTDPTAASKLFQKKLEYFSSSLWDMWEMQHAVERATKHWDKENGEEEEENEEKDEEASPLMQPEAMMKHLDQIGKRVCKVCCHSKNFY
jgi:hypothetical protein